MSISRLLGLTMTLGLVPVTVVGGVVTTEMSSRADVHQGGPSQPTLVDIRAGHHPHFDRVVFEFRGGLPVSHHARYVDRLIADGSGNVVPVAGRAILRVDMVDARAHNESGGPTVPAHRVFALPNVMTTTRSSDFEGTVTYGIGLSRGTSFHVFTLRSPARVVVDVRAAFRTVDRRVWYFDRRAFAEGAGPYFVPRLRPVIPTTPATGLLDRLFAGPLPAERADGLRLLTSRATGFAIRSVRNGVARVRLTGGCSSAGSTVSIAGEITPTLRHLPTVRWVKIYSPSGHTEHPFGHRDSIPVCLEP